MPALHEQYRPQSFADVVGQDKAVRQIQSVIARGWGGRAWWITGASGTGKSTLARIIAQHGADDFGIEEIDAGLLTPALLRETEEGMRFKGMVKAGRVVIVNEAHGMRRDTIKLLLVALEKPRLRDHCVWIFTTTAAGQQSLFENDTSGDASPLLSRCTEIVLANDSDSRKAFIARAKQIAQQEGLDGVPDLCYVGAIQACKGNMRAMLQKIESGAFRDDAVEILRNEYAAIEDVEGEVYETRRARLHAALATLV